MVMGGGLNMEVCERGSKLERAYPIEIFVKIISVNWVETLPHPLSAGGLSSALRFHWPLGSLFPPSCWGNPDPW